MKLTTLLALVLFVLSLRVIAAPTPRPFIVETMVVLEIDASINPATARYLLRHLNEARPGDLVVVKLNTPGGLVSTTKDIITSMGKSPVPVIIWVTPPGASATSAGAIIAAGAHGLFMDQGTNIGAATPVGLGSDIPESDGRAKAINDLRALVESLSELRGRNAKGFSEMIATSASFTSQDALKKKIIDGEASSLEALRSKLAGARVSLNGEARQLEFAQALSVVERPMDLGMSLLNVFAHPTTAYVLFVLGVALLYFEFQAPGGFLAGSVGVVLLILAAIAFQVLPLNFGAIALLVAGVFLLVLEVFITSYGLLTLAGLGCLFAGSLFLFDTPDAWMSVQYTTIFSTLGGVVAFVGFIAYYLARHRSAKVRFFEHLGESATVVNAIAAEGTQTIYQVKTRGEIWRARGPAGLAQGAHVKIVQEDPQDLTLTIQQISHQE